ncbi:MAG: hypothetical protein EPN26_09305 [Rhodospirillales bacterium]|nr:MAG: hypothetical protein EPN26_09305 [Rhodospirillales bacterium]
MTGMPPEGRIGVRLALENGQIAGVGIEPRPLPPLDRLLRGRPCLEAAQLIPRLFSLCAEAQTQAALGAMDRALYLTPTPASQAARTLLVLAETVQEHARHVLIDGPLLFSQTPDVEAARLIRAHVAALKPMVQAGETNHGTLAEWLERLRQLVLDHVFGGKDLSAFALTAEIEDWGVAQNCAAARLLAEIRFQGLAGLGVSNTPLMGHLDAQWLKSALERDESGGFVHRPKTQEGFCRETGPLARQHDHPLIRAIQSSEGYGLLARFCARLIELGHAVTALALTIPLLDAKAKAPAFEGTGQGIGLAEAARGRLVHWVRIEDGRIADYRMLAPTEWNFHPDGAFAQGLRGLKAASHDAARYLARLQAFALDPCVSLAVEVYDA